MKSNNLLKISTLPIPRFTSRVGDEKCSPFAMAIRSGEHYEIFKKRRSIAAEKDTRASVRRSIPYFVFRSGSVPGPVQSPQSSRKASPLHSTSARNPAGQCGADQRVFGAACYSAASLTGRYSAQTLIVWRSVRLRSTVSRISPAKGVFSIS